RRLRTFAETERRDEAERPDKPMSERVLDEGMVHSLGGFSSVYRIKPRRRQRETRIGCLFTAWTERLVARRRSHEQCPGQVAPARFPPLLPSCRRHSSRLQATPAPSWTLP